MADNKKLPPVSSQDTLCHCRIEGAQVGKIAGIQSGRIMVDFSANRLGPVPARLTSMVEEKLRHTNAMGREVLMIFEENDPGRPVIIDTLYSLLHEITDHSSDALMAETPEEVSVDRKRIMIDAEEEIVLRCGEASITLTRAGKVLIRGNYLLSRSSGANRIKGGSVQIN